LVTNRTLYGEFLRRKFAENVTEAAARKQFDEELAKFVPGDEIHARHILVPTEEEAKAIIAELDKGGNFVEIAKAKSQDPGSGKNGGDLGFFAKGQMVKPFEDAAFALEPGKYTTTPVKSDFGWHIILVEEKQKQPPPTFESQAQRIQQQMMQATFNKEMEALRATAKIEVTPPPGAPAAAPTAPAPAEPAPAEPAPAPAQ
jgi:peptidyl-prolyl cis-trans isomerase C